MSEPVTYLPRNAVEAIIGPQAEKKFYQLPRDALGEGSKIVTFSPLMSPDCGLLPVGDLALYLRTRLLFFLLGKATSVEIRG